MLKENIIIQQQHAAMIGILEGIITSDSSQIPMPVKFATCMSVKLMLEQFDLRNTEAAFFNEPIRKAISRFEIEYQQYLDKNEDTQKRMTLENILTYMMVSAV